MNLSKKTFFILLGLLFVFMLARYIDRSKPRQCSDFRVTYAAAERFAKKENIYSKFEDPTIANYKYSPFFAMLTAPLAAFTLYQAGAIFFSLNFLVTILIFIYSKKLITEDDEPLPLKSFWLYLIPLVLTARYILGVLDAGQINLMMVGFVVFGLYALKKGRDAWAAALIILGIMFKYTPFIFIPYLFFRKKWKFTAWCAFFTLFYCLAPMFYVGLNTGISYLKEWLPFVVKTSLDIGSICDFKNQSFYSMMLRYFADGQYFCDRIMDTGFTIEQITYVTILLSGLLYILMIAPSKIKSPAGPAVDYALLFIGLALFNANSWAFNYMALIFSYMTAVYWLSKTGGRDRWMLFAMGFAFFVSFATRDLIGKKFREISDIYSSVTISALILMLALFKIKFFPPAENLSKNKIKI